MRNQFIHCTREVVDNFTPLIKYVYNVLGCRLNIPVIIVDLVHKLKFSLYCVYSLKVEKGRCYTQMIIHSGGDLHCANGLI